MRFYKIKALLKLGLQDLLKNANVLIYIILPIGFAFLYSSMDTMPKDFCFALCVLLSLAMVPVALMGTVIAEEKEKNTLRTLMLNDVKASEILIAKALICLMFVVINNILIYYICGLSLTNFLTYQLIGLFTGLAIIFFGAVVGLLAKNQMSAGLLSMPFMLLLMAPLFISMLESKVLTKLSSLLPTDAMMSLFTAISATKYTFKSVGIPIIVIASWFIISYILFNIVYKKVGLDN